MKKLIASILAIAMVMSLATFQIFTTADAAEELYYLKLDGTCETSGTIFSVTTTKSKLNFKDKPERTTFMTENSGSITVTSSLKMEDGVEISFTAPGNGKLKLYFTNLGTSISVKKDSESEQVISLDGSKYEVEIDTTAGNYVIKRKSGESDLAYIEWIPAETGPSVSVSGLSGDSVKFKVKDGSAEPVSLTVTVSDYMEGTFFAVSSDTNVATVSYEGPLTREVAPNGTYTVTITPVATTVGSDAHIYIGVAPTGKNPQNNDENSVKDIDNLQTISVSVLDSTSTEERDAAKADGKLYVPITGLGDIANLKTDSNLVIVLKDQDGNYKAIGTDGSKWLFEVTVKEDAVGKFLIIEDGSDFILTVDTIFSDLSSSYVGKGKLKVNGKYFRPQDFSDKNGPFGTNSSEMRIFSSNGQYYLRGNGDNYYFGYKDGSYTGKLTKEDKDCFTLVDIYLPVSKDSKAVYYYDYKGDIASTQYVIGDSFKPTVPSDVIIDGVTYTLLGWTQNDAYKGKDNIISGAESVNLYGFDKTANSGKGGYDLNADKKELYNKYDLIKYDSSAVNTGTNDGTPRAGEFEAVNISGKDSIDLYPIYVRGGYITEATATGAGGTKIAISSSAALNTTTPRWLGSINVEIYNDGILVGGNAQTIYFYYNSDNMVDIQLVLSGGNGAYVINGVVAEQSGGSNGKGLSKKGNWLTPTGGMLDNVIGGTTVKVYMSTRYTAEFYLDGVKQTLTPFDKFNTEEYSTTASLDAFKDALKTGSGDGNYIVGANSGEFTDFTQVPDSEGFLQENSSSDGSYNADGKIVHGGKYLFGYLVKTYGHDFDIPETTATGKTTTDLVNGDQWVLKGEKIGATNNFDVTENLAKADEGVFRFYAYTKGDLTVNKEVSGAGASTDKTFQFTITFTAPAGTSLPTSFTDAEDKTITISSDGTATFTVTAKKSVTITGLPTGTTYTITEGDAEGYTPVAKEQSGIIGTGSNTVTFTNDFSLSTGSLTITKVVDGDVKVSGTFTFKITPEDGVYIGKDHPVTGAKISDDGTYYTVTINYTEGGDNSVTINGLPVGSYTVEEQTSNLGGLYTPSVTPETVTVSQGASASVTVTNTVKSGDLNVTKKFELSPGLSAGSLPASADKDWDKKDVTFTVSFTLPSGIKEFTLKHGPESTPVTINGTNSSFEFTLKNGGYENYRITGIPYGVGYEITEKSVGSSTNHYVATYSNDSGQIAATSTDVTCTNTYHLVAVNCGALVIKKDVVGDTEQTSFKFKITFDGSKANKDAFDAFKREQGLDGDNSKIYTLDLENAAYLLIEVPYGTGYTIEEVFESGAKPTRIYPFFEESTKEEADVVSGETVSGVISSDYSNDTVHFVNMYLADLTITKVVEVDEYAQGPDPDKEYVFYFDFSASHNYEGLVVTYTIGDVTKTITEPGTLEIHLKAGETATFHGIPVGASHTITEDVSTRGESVKIVTNSGDVDETNASTSGEIVSGGVKITFTNKYTTLKTGSITVTKTVNGTGRQPVEGTKFSIEIELTDAAGNGLNGKFGNVTFRDGKATVELEKGQSVTLENVPYGTQYKVTEKDSQGADSYTITDTGSGTLKSESVTVTVTNTYTKTYGNLKITKNVTGLDADANKDFTFTVILKDAEGNPLTNQEFKFDGSKSGTIKTGDTVTLKHGENIVIHDLPDGTQYEVTEAEDPEYTSAATENGSSKIVGNTSKIVTFTNTRKTGYLTVTKTVSGGNGVKVDRTFTFTVTSDRSFNGTIKLSNGKTIEFKNGTATLEIQVNGTQASVTLQNLPTGKYTVTETTTGDFTTSYVSSSEVVVEGDKTATVTVTNEVMTGSLKITKEFVLSPELQGRPTSSLPADWNKKPVTFTVTFILPSNLTEFTVTYGGKTKTINASDTTVTITLTDPYECEITGIPYGVGYTVEEAAVGDATNHYVDTYEKDVDDKGVISNASTHVACTNTFHLVPVGYGALVIKKEVVGETSQTEFTFEVEYDGKIETVTVKKGSYALLEIPAETAYTVREVFQSGETRPTRIVPRFDSAEAGDVVNGETVSGVISQQFNNDTVIFSNQYLADLTLTKEVEAGDDVQGPDKDQEYIFHFDFSASPDYAGIVVTYTINGVTKNITEPGTLEIRLKAGETATFHGIPVGASHTITEDVSTRGESVGITTNSGTVDTASASTSGEIIPGGVEITFTNKYTTLKTGSITVTKTVNGSGRQPAEGTKFSIEIELTDAAGNGLNGKYGDVTLTNGKVTVELKAGEFVTLENVPYGTQYKVTEKNSQGADSVKITDAGSGTLKSESVTVTVTNTYTKTYGDLKITKNVSGLDADTDRDFTFTVILKDAEGNPLTGKTFNYDGSKSGTIKTGDTVTLKHGESIVIHDLPDGTQYEVTETDDAEYTSAATENGSSKIVGNTSKIVTFTNTRKTGYLTVTKEISGGNDVKVNRTFTFTVTSDRSFTGTIRLSNGNTVAFKNGTATLELSVSGTQASVTLQNLPTGKYTVTETTTGSFTTAYAPATANTSGVIVEDGRTAAVTVTNTVLVGKLTVAKEVTSNDAHSQAAAPDETFKITVTFTLPTYLKSFTVTASANGGSDTYEVSNGTVLTLPLKKGQSVELSGIPYGVGYSVAEEFTKDNQANYEVTYTGSPSGTVSGPQASVTVHNKFYLMPENTGSIWVVKRVQGTFPSMSEAEFAFEVTFTRMDAVDEDVFNQFLETLGAEGNTYTFKIKNGENKVILGVPAGVEYTVREVTGAMRPAPANVVVEAAPGDEDAKTQNGTVTGGALSAPWASGKIDGSRDVDGFTFYNQYLDDLVIEVLIGEENDVPEGTEFTFTLKFSGLEASQVSSLMRIDDANGTRGIEELLEDFMDDDTVTITLRKVAGDAGKLRATIYNVPLGVSHYEFVEIGGRGSTVTWDVASDRVENPTHVGVDTDDQTFDQNHRYVTFKNVYVGGWLKLTKDVAGDDIPAVSQAYTFTVTPKGETEPVETFTLTGPGEKLLFLPAGEYIVTETASGTSTSTSVKVGEGGAISGKTAELVLEEGETVAVTVTNTYTSGGTRPPELDTSDHFSYMMGYPDGTIRPNSPITRAEVASILFRLLTDGTRDAYKATANSFPDVNEGAWYNLAVSTLERMGILNGYDDGTFRPDRPITRAEMAVIVGQFYGASGTTGNGNYYLDVGAQDWFSFFVEFVTEKGIMVGVGGGNFEPNRTLTRAEAMAVFNRILGRSPDKDSFDRVRNDPRYVVWPDNMNMDVWYYADVQEATQSHEYFLRPTGKELWTDALGMKEWEG